jgi:hypothetical protein
MQLLTFPDAHRNGFKVVPESSQELNREDRVSEALGLLGERLPRVDEETLSKYYTYLTVRLSFPFTAYYPEPKSTLEEVLHHCTVLELLDPANKTCDEFGGIYCKIRKGIYEITLPLIELEIPNGSPNFQFIEDYWYWFWNWR